LTTDELRVQEAHTIGIYTVYHALSEPSKTFYEGQMQAFGLNIATMEKKSSAEQQELISAALYRLAAALDAEGGTNGHFIGDSITFADLAAAAYIKWFTVISDEAEYVMTLNGGRWKRLLDEIKVQY
jgi:glutathione S-transferase